MITKTEELTKRYYTIGEVSEMFSVSKSLIRFWETEFEILKPYKNSKGDRRFTKQNIEQLGVIYRLVKQRGFTLKGAKQEIRSNKGSVMRQQKIIQKLTRVRNDLAKLREEIE